MKIEESRRRQDKLEQYLRDLSSCPLDDEELRKYAIQLKSIYTDGFRHMYSRFFPVLVEIFREDNNYSQDFLSNNLEQLRSIVEKDFFENDEKSDHLYVGLYIPLTKLADHINLEIGRLSEITVHDNKLKDLEKRNESLHSKIVSAEQTLEKMNADLQKSQKEYVAILGIFAAAVLTFTGALTFSSSVLENITAASIYRTVAIALIIGIVLVNGIYALFYCISQIVQNENPKSLKPLVIANAVILLLLLLNTVAWYFGVVENRNQKIDHVSDYGTTTIVEDESNYTQQ